MVTPYLPLPGYSGGQTRSFNLLKSLSKKCEVTLFSFVLPDQEPKHIKHLEKYCKKIITIKRGKTWSLKKILFTGFSSYPFLVANYFSPPLKKSIDSELKKNRYNLVHVECFYLMPNIPNAKIPILLVDQTIEFAVYQHFVESLPKKFLFLKPLFWLDVFKLKLWETLFWKRTDCLVAVSKEDQKLMKRLSKRKVKIVPNGVDEILIKQKQVKKHPQPTVLYGVANFKWMQNKEGAMNLLKFVWPKIKKKIPEAKLHIAGRHSAELLAKRKELIKFPESVKIDEVKDAQLTYRKSWVLVAPMRSGGGSRTKFFEAMACSLPVVTTPEGIEGLDAEKGKEVVIGDSFSQLAQAAVDLLKNRKKREKIGAAGRQLVKKKYSWEVSAQKLLKIYQRIAHEKS